MREQRVLRAQRVPRRDGDRGERDVVAHDARGLRQRGRARDRKLFHRRKVDFRVCAAPKQERRAHAKMTYMQIAIAQLEPGRRRSCRQRARDPRPRSPKPSAPAHVWSSRRSSRLPAIRPKTCCCGRRSSMPARAELAALAARVASHAGDRRLSGTRGRQVLQRARGAARRAASPQSIASSACRTTRCSTRSAISSRGARPASSTSTACASGSSSARTCWFPAPAAQAKAAGAEIVVVANGSPYHTQQQALRRQHVGRARAGNGTADRLREPRRRAGRAGLRRRVVRRRRARRGRRSSCRRGTRRSRS